MYICIFKSLISCLSLFINIYSQLILCSKLLIYIKILCECVE